MIVSEARIAANRRNALRSTGPKTAEGKERSRANALKHGLCASVVVHEDALVVQRRTEEFFKTLRPQNNFHCWLVTEIAVLSVRIDRGERIERRVRDKISIKAELMWDDDRRLEASLLGEQLGNRPEIVGDQLRRSLHGCEWMMGRWAMLAHSADVKGCWTSAQTDLAFDLLGTPGHFREGHKPGASLDFDGQVIAGSENPAEVARREIAILKERRSVVEGLDEVCRSLTEADLGDDTDPELRRTRRYEGTLHNRLRWCMSQLRFQSPMAAPYPGLKTVWLGQDEPAPPKLEVAAPSIPETQAVVEPEPPAPEGRLKRIEMPFDLEVDEYPLPGEDVIIPMILANRREKKLQKAEDRRVAKRRKIEKLRA
jgi:hypothetical protein